MLNEHLADTFTDLAYSRKGPLDLISDQVESAMLSGKPQLFLEHLHVVTLKCSCDKRAAIIPCIKNLRDASVTGGTT